MLWHAPTVEAAVRQLGPSRVNHQLHSLNQQTQMTPVQVGSIYLYNHSIILIWSVQDAYSSLYTVFVCLLVYI